MARRARGYTYRSEREVGYLENVNSEYFYDQRGARAHAYDKRRNTITSKKRRNEPELLKTNGVENGEIKICHFCIIMD